MTHLRLSLNCLLASLLLFSTITSTAAEFPEKAIEFIIPFGAGGGADIEGRLLAKEMSNVLGVPVVPINKPGAGGAVTYTYVKNAKPDGYTLAWNSTSVLTTTNIGNVDFDYNALDHVGRVEYQPMVIAVKADAQWQTLDELIATCKQDPGALKVGNSGTGSATHLAAIAMANVTGCDPIHVPLGIKRRNAGLLSGETDAMAAPMTGALKLHQGKKIRILSHMSKGENAQVPEVPSMQALGYDMEMDLFRGLSVPKDTPAAVKTKLAEAMSQAARSDAFMKLAAQKGFTVDPMDSAAFETYLAPYNEQVKDIMQNAGLYQSKKSN